MGNIFGIGDAVKGMTKATKATLTSISKEVTETRLLLTEVTNKTLQRIDEELTQTRVFLTEKAWPEVNKTMSRFRGVLDSTDTFLATSTFTVKVVALLIALCATYVVHKLRSERMSFQRWQRRQINAFTAVVNTFLDIMFCLCIVLSFVLVLQLLKEHFNVMWPHSIPFIILIPSLTTLAILFQHLKAIFKVIFTLLRLILYVIIEYPIIKAVDPVTTGGSRSGYMMTVPFLQIVIYIIIYGLIPFVAWVLTVDILLVQWETSILKFLLILYVVCYASAMLVSATNSLLISMIIRPLWAFQARRNLEMRP